MTDAPRSTNEILEDILEELRAIRSEVACIPKEGCD